MQAENGSGAFLLLLNQYIENSTLSKNEIIHAVMMDRSSFFQVLRGKRLPTQEQLRTLGTVLRLPDKEQKNLQEAYLRTTLGEQAWQYRQEAKKCFSTLAKSDSLRAHCGAPGTVYTAEEKLPQGELRIGAENVQQLLRHMINRAFSASQPVMDLFMPATNQGFYETLQAMIFDCPGKPMRIRQLVQFPSGKETLKAGILQEFDNMLRFWTIGCKTYEVSYYYDSSQLENSLGVAFPYYILMEDQMALLSADFKKAFSTTLPAHLDAQKRQFDFAMENAHCVDFRFANMQEYETAYERILRSTVEITEIAASPCASALATDALLKKYIAPGPQRDWTMQHCALWEKNLHSVEYFSLQGLRSFARTGVTPELRWLGIKPIEREDRAQVLQNLIKTLQSTSYVMDETQLEISASWSIMVWENEALLMFNYDDPESLRLIQEKNIAYTFTEFFRGLPESEMVLPKQAAQEEISAMIRELGQPAPPAPSGTDQKQKKSRKTAVKG